MKIAADGSTLTFIGHFDARSTFAARAAIYDHLEANLDTLGDVVIDLSEVEFIDLTAIRVLAVATRNAARQGQHLTLRGCTGPVLRLLHMSRLFNAVEVERVAIGA